jgi:integrase
VLAEAWSRSEVRGRASNARVVSVMFGDAVRYGDHAGPNPFAGLGKSSRKARRRLDPDWLTEDQVHKLAGLALQTCGAFGSQFRAMILFAAYVGLRPGELFALERRDVNGDLVEIRQAVGADGRLKTPKNGKSRVVLLPPQAAAALRDLVLWPDVPWLFVTPNGQQFTKGTHYSRWNPTRAMFGRPGMDFYELRHFCATHLLQLGASDADVAHQLGHSDGGKLVRETYGHPADRYALDRLRSAFGTQVVRLDAGSERRHGRKAGAK